MRLLRVGIDDRLAGAHVRDADRRSHARVRLERNLVLGFDAARCGRDGRERRLRVDRSARAAEAPPRELSEATGAARMCSNSASPRGNGGVVSLHVTRSSREALIACHSCGATTAMKSPLRTTRAPGIAAIDASSTRTGTAFATGGRNVRACSMPGQAHVMAVLGRRHDVAGMSLRGTGVPTTRYCRSGSSASRRP